MVADPMAATGTALWQPLLAQSAATDPLRLNRCDADAVVRRVHRRLVSVCCVIMFFCYVDRTNLGLAADSFIRDLGITQTEYGTGVGMFFVGYVLLQAPSNLVLERVGAPVWLGVILVVWGLAAVLMAFVKTPLEFYIVRLLLGIAEAGTLPGIWYYFTLFLPEDRLTYPMAAVDFTAVVSQIVAAPMAAALLCLDGVLGFRGWQWLFVVEGILPVCFGAWVLVTLPRDPRCAGFLTPVERDWLCQEIRRKGKIRPSAQSGDGPWSKLLDATSRVGFWKGALTAFLRNFSYCVIYFWATLLIESLVSHRQLRPCPSGSTACTGSLRSTSEVVVLLTAVPYSLTAVFTLVVGWHSDQSKERRWHVSLPYILGAGFFSLLPILSRVSVYLAFASLTLGMMGTIGGGPPMNSLVASQISASSKAVGLGIFNSIANLGGFLGPIFTGRLVDATQSYSLAIWLILGLPLFLAGVAVLWMKDPVLKARPQQADLPEQQGSGNGTETSEDDASDL